MGDNVHSNALANLVYFELSENALVQMYSKLLSKQLRFPIRLGIQPPHIQANTVSKTAPTTKVYFPTRSIV